MRGAQADLRRRHGAPTIALDEQRRGRPVAVPLSRYHSVGDPAVGNRQPRKRVSASSVDAQEGLREAVATVHNPHRRQSTAHGDLARGEDCVDPVRRTIDDHLFGDIWRNQRPLAVNSNRLDDVASCALPDTLPDRALISLRNERLTILHAVIAAEHRTVRHDTPRAAADTDARLARARHDDGIVLQHHVAGASAHENTACQARDVVA